ncbi:YopX family protein [uncultured Duncaniella sp.]|uniref:YopX family protein n=1 Tax=uncultured Duncaniella sp. TaxID=2768039 RepID=UPI0025DE39C5|nr:YopX family protein [uncultured Duncaniella sp.]
MNRPFKFRGKDIHTGEWLYGDLVHSSDGRRTAILVNDRDSYDECEVQPRSVGQFTGHKDCNGHEIYEDDIVFILVRSHLACIHWDHVFSNFIIDWGSACTSLSIAMAGNLTIVGNEHDMQEEKPRARLSLSDWIESLSSMETANRLAILKNSNQS